MSTTPNLLLTYLTPSQSQPEVPINDAWDKIDAAVHALVVGETGETGGSPLTVHDGTTSVANVIDLSVVGGTVTSPSAGHAVATFIGGGGGGSPLTVTDGTTSVASVTTLLLTGATVTSPSAGNATATIAGGGGGGGGSLTLTDGVNSVSAVDTIHVQGLQVVPSPSQTSLLLHMDGTAGSTTFTDSSVYGVTVTPLSGAAIETSNVKFGTGALAGTGGASLTVPVTPGGACDLSTGDFTVEGWVYVDGGHTYNLAFTLGTYGSGPYAICYANVGQPFKSNGSQFSGCQSGGLIVVNTWHHVAIVRHSGNMTMYLDGVGGAPVADATNWSTVAAHTIGAGYPGQELSGFMDEVRIQKATAAYTANFTPPAAPFTAGGGTPGLATLRTPLIFPPTIADLVYWFKADGVNARTGKALPLLENDCPWLRQNVAAAGGSGATLTNAALNSLPALTFPGTANGRYTAAAFSPMLTNCTIFVVFKILSYTYQAFVCGLTGSIELRLNPAGTLELLKTQSASLGQSTGGVPSGAFVQANVVYNSGTGVFAFRYGSAAKGGGTSAQSITAVNDSIAWNPAGVSDDFQGSMAELIVYDRDLTLTEIQSVEAYLLAKWGV